MPKVSVIIPVYNAKEYLRRCLDSVCNQTLMDIEIICVNDCSTDNSLDILNEYAENYPNIKVIDCKLNGGESVARNIGLDNATGEYLGFVDNDDEIDLDFYEKLYAKAKETNADIVKGEVRQVGYDGKETFSDLNKKIKQGDHKLYFTHYWWTAIYKRTLIENNNIRLLEEYPLGGDVLFLNQTLLACEKLELVDDTYYHYYRREDSGDSKVLSFEKLKSVLDIHEMIVDNILSYKDFEKLPKDVIQHQFNWGLNIIFNDCYRCKAEEALDYSVNKAIKVFNAIKNYYKSNEYPIYKVIIDILEKNDFEELKNFFITNDTPQKMFFANLRFVHLQRNKINA